jgi:hypothetical protein
LNDIDIVAKALALNRGAAVELATAGRYELTSTPLMLAMFAFSGEDATVSTVLIGRYGERAPRLAAAITNPRNRTDQYGFFRRIGDELFRYFEQCEAERTYPQVVVSGPSGINHLHALTHRVLGLSTRPKPGDTDEKLAVKAINAAVRSGFGHTIGYLSERALLAGQQCVVPATDLLTSIWATGQSTIEDAQLHTVRAWIEDGPPSLSDRLAVAETLPSGARTMPEFDNKTLAPLLSRLQAARKGDEVAEMTRIGEMVEAALLKHLRPQYDAIAWAIKVVKRRRTTNDALRELAVAERVDYDYSYARTFVQNVPLQFRNLPATRTRRYLVAEARVEAVETLFATYDRVECSRLEQAGKLFHIQVIGQAGAYTVSATGAFPLGLPAKGETLIAFGSGRVLEVYEVLPASSPPQIVLRKGRQPLPNGAELAVFAGKKNGSDLSAAFVGRAAKERLARPSWIYERSSTAPSLKRLHGQQQTLAALRNLR